MLKKTILALLFVISASANLAQVIFTSCPIDYQLVGRDIITNYGSLNISGQAINVNIQYDSILVELYRNEQPYQVYSSVLEFESDTALFNFNIPIEAELANYSIKIISSASTGNNLEKVVHNIVAGDVYIIQGQSNAEAAMVDGSANSNQSEFIRVYASGTHFSNLLPLDNNWYIGQGDSYRTTPGNTGQWGLKLAKMLVDSLNIPIAIFNGAHGGKEISFFQCPSNYKTSLDSNYSRLYYRLNKTNLTNYVRAVIWSQGEWDGSNNGNTPIEDYKSRFLKLRGDWYRDYPNIEHIYIFQTKNGCGGFLHRIKEAQRQLAYENMDISIMSTAALTHFEDECHFKFHNGYESFATRLFPLILSDIYGLPSNSDINAPMILYAELVNPFELVIGTTAVQLKTEGIAEDFYLENSEAAVITEITTLGNKIFFSLSKFPGNNASISFLANESGIGNFITNENNIEIICFYRFQISTNSMDEESTISQPVIYPIPCTNELKIRMPGNKMINNIVIFDLTGRKIKESELNNVNNSFNLNLKSGYYLVKIEDTDFNTYKKKIIVVNQ